MGCRLWGRTELDMTEVHYEDCVSTSLVAVHKGTFFLVHLTAVLPPCHWGWGRALALPASGDSVSFWAP